MHKFSTIIAAGLLAITVGCRSTDCTAILSHSPWEENTKSYLDGYKHILVVCIYEDHWEDRGPHNSLHHFKATVIRTYKGDWSIGERVAIVHGVDAPALTTSNGVAGDLRFVFTNEHTKVEISLDTGDFANYDSELERVLQCVFPQRRRG